MSLQHSLLSKKATSPMRCGQINTLEDEISLQFYEFNSKIFYCRIWTDINEYSIFAIQCLHQLIGSILILKYPLNHPRNSFLGTLVTFDLGHKWCGLGQHNWLVISGNSSCKLCKSFIRFLNLEIRWVIVLC